MSLNGVMTAVKEVLKMNIPPLIESNQIGFCSPAETEESYLLGIYVFKINKDMRYQMTGRVHIDSDVTQKAPLCMEASFMITPYAGKKSGIQDDYKLIDRVLQLWHDTADIAFSSKLQPMLVPAPRVELISPDEDTVSKIWQFPGVPYRTSLFYRVAPIAIPSALQTVTERVADADYRTDVQES